MFQDFVLKLVACSQFSDWKLLNIKETDKPCVGKFLTWVHFSDDWIVYSRPGRLHTYKKKYAYGFVLSILLQVPIRALSLRFSILVPLVFLSFYLTLIALISWQALSLFKSFVQKIFADSFYMHNGSILSSPYIYLFWGSIYASFMFCS